MISFNDLDGFNEELERVNKYMESILFSRNVLMNDIMTWILHNRGKQLRPIMLLLASRFGEKSDEVEKYAAVIEICHMATLVHDDIVDDADYRRNQLSVQKKFGKKMAVYAGDYMIFSVMSKSGIKLKRKQKEIFYKLENICYGELSQNDFLFDINVTEEQYLSNITGKTATLFELACYVGAVESNVPEEYIEALSMFGLYFGILFQIRDDLLDFNESVKVKPTFQDFKAGIYTIPVIAALSDSVARPLIIDAIQYCKQNGMDSVAKRKIMDIINQASGFEKSLKLMSDYYEKAMESLRILPDNKAKQKLSELLEYVYDISKG